MPLGLWSAAKNFLYAAVRHGYCRARRKIFGVLCLWEAPKKSYRQGEVCAIVSDVAIRRPSAS